MFREHGGVETTGRLFASEEPPQGLFEFYYCDLLNESMEAIVLQDKFRTLFTEKELA
jgi:hypothetical protein